MDVNESRYFDFSTDDDDIDALRPGAGTDPILKNYAEELQRIVGNRNPVASIRSLVALHAATDLGTRLGHFRFLKYQNAMLTIIAALLAYIAYVLT